MAGCVHGRARLDGDDDLLPRRAVQDFELERGRKPCKDTDQLFVPSGPSQGRGNEIAIVHD